VSFADVVADPDRGDLLDQEPAHVLEVHQLGQQPAYRLGTGFGGDQFRLGAGRVQHVVGDRMALGVVAVQQPFRCPAVHLGGELPAEVERVLDAEVEPLSPKGGWTCAASSARNTRPVRYRSASRVASVNRDSQRGEWTPESVPA
jgi:hypothetical protein